VAGETTTRGRSVALEHDVRPATGITDLRPTSRGTVAAVLAIVLLAVAVGTGDSTLFLVPVAVGLPVVIAPAVVLARARRAAGTEIHMMLAPPVVPVGAPCHLLVQMSHAGVARLPPFGLDRPSDHWHAGVSSARPSGAAARLRGVVAPGRGHVIRWDRSGSETGASMPLVLSTRRRGVWSVGPLRLWVHDPFALFALTVAVARHVTLVVHPVEVVDVASPLVRPGSSGSRHVGAGSAAIPSDDPGGEWTGLRPYEPGDRLHLLSWQAEARSGALLVHDFRPDSEDVVTIVLDDRAGVHRRQAFESALGSVLGLVIASAERLGADYAVSTFSGRRVRGPTTPDGLVALAAFLAETQPVRSPDPGEAPTAVGATGALVVTTSTAAPTMPVSVDRRSMVIAS
jgi:uncharacterized protein (DUF58 family)